MYTAAAAEPKSGLGRRIPELLISLGVPTHLKGFCYLGYAIYLTAAGGELCPSLIADIYPEVERHFSAKPRTAERNIRTAVEAAFLSGNRELLIKMFGTRLSLGGKVTNGEFIRTAAYEVMKEG